MLLVTLTLTLVPAMATVAAAQNKLTVSHPVGSLHLQISGPSDHVDKTTPITAGRIEIQEGPATGAPAGKLFILTRLSLRFADLSLSTRSLGNTPLPLIQVGAHLPDAIAFYAVEQQPGIYRINIPHHGPIVAGHPDFEAAAKVDESYFAGEHQIDQRFFGGPERISEPITGTIDLNAGTIQAKATFHAETKYLGIGVERTLTITLAGAFSRRPPGTPPSPPPSSPPTGPDKGGTKTETGTDGKTRAH
jgi:hypothetical protein